MCFYGISIFFVSLHFSYILRNVEPYHNYWFALILYNRSTFYFLIHIAFNWHSINKSIWIKVITISMLSWSYLGKLVTIIVILFVAYLSDLLVMTKVSFWLQVCLVDCMKRLQWMVVLPGWFGWLGWLLVPALDRPQQRRATATPCKEAFGSFFSCKVMSIISISFALKVFNLVARYSCVCYLRYLCNLGSPIKFTPQLSINLEFTQLHTTHRVFGE